MKSDQNSMASFSRELGRDGGTPRTPSNKRPTRPYSLTESLTPAAALLADGSNAYTLSSLSALVGDFNAESFHDKWKECYKTVAKVRYTLAPDCLLSFSHSSTCPALWQDGIVTPTIIKSGMYYANRLIVLMQLEIKGDIRLVPMVVDTAAPTCFIDEHALKEFGFKADPHPEEHIKITIAGKDFDAVVIQADVSNKLLKGLNILGMDAIREIISSNGVSTIEKIFVEAFNGPNLALLASKFPRRAQDDQENDQDVLRGFFGFSSAGTDLVDEVLAKVAGRDLSAPIYDSVRIAIERCKPK